MRMRTGFVVLLGLLACGGCGKQKSTDELIGDLNAPQERDRLIAVRLLPEHRADAAKVIPALIGALKNRAVDVRLSAAIGLGGFGDQAKDAIPALQEAQRDHDARVRQAAGVALSRIDPKFAPKAAPPKKR
ncbi:MAG TPA: HEAT repeat domain-containing protein [Gemmataceae bacterium]|jgi:HEAT repeat protein